MALLRLLRPHQWTKNVLLFLPALMAHKTFDLDLVWSLLIAFICFGCVASAGYVINDLKDIRADKLHPTKCHRPLASGQVSTTHAGLMLLFLICFGFTLAHLTQNFVFVALLALYFRLTVSYSFWFKRVVLLDIVILAGLYTLRIFTGGVAVKVPISEWLMAFSLFFFFSMAAAKRYSELQGKLQSGKESVPGRGYQPSDYQMVSVLGCASGLISALVMALYVNSPNVVSLYPSHQFLWLLCPLVIYWISRIWLIAGRGNLDEDPILFAVKDSVSFFVVIVGVLILTISSLSLNVKVLG